MSKTLKQIKAEALALTDRDRDRLIDELVETSARKAIGADLETIESALRSRMDGAFIQIENPEAHFEGRLRYYRKETARRNAHA